MLRFGGDRRRRTLRLFVVAVTLVGGEVDIVEISLQLRALLVAQPAIRGRCLPDMVVQLTVRGVAAPRGRKRRPRRIVKARRDEIRNTRSIAEAPREPQAMVRGHLPDQVETIGKGMVVGAFGLRRADRERLIVVVRLTGVFVQLLEIGVRKLVVEVEAPVAHRQGGELETRIAESVVTHAEPAHGRPPVSAVGQRAQRNAQNGSAGGDLLVARGETLDLDRLDALRGQGLQFVGRGGPVVDVDLTDLPAIDLEGPVLLLTHAGKQHEQVVQQPVPGERIAHERNGIAAGAAFDEAREDRHLVDAVVGRLQHNIADEVRPSQGHGTRRRFVGDVGKLQKTRLLRKRGKAVTAQRVGDHSGDNGRIGRPA